MSDRHHSLAIEKFQIVNERLEAPTVQGDSVMYRPTRFKPVLVLSTVLFFALTFIASSAFAQVTSGTIFGAVKDPTGAMVKGATVTIAVPLTDLRAL